MNAYGFKELSTENWQQPDETLSFFVRLSSDGKTSPITGDEWLKEILAPKLAESVPNEVKVLFEVARGTLAYGYFFYPLFTLSAEQVLRVAEAAITHKCLSIGTPRSVDTFEKKINHLVAQKIIPEKQKVSWDVARQLRNSSSHPTHQSIILPRQSISTFYRVAQIVNGLFTTSS